MKPYAFSGMLCTSMLIFGLIGYNIDGWLHTTPLFVIVGLMYSIIGSIILLKLLLMIIHLMKLFKSLPFYKRSNYSTACNNLSLTTHLQKRSFY